MEIDEELDSPELHDQLAGVAKALEQRRGELIERQIEALAAFPEYGNVPAEDLVRSCDRNVVRVVSMLRGEAELPPDVVEDERVSGIRRARQGIPAEVVVAAYRAVIGVIRDAFLEAAPLEGVTVEGILLGVRRLWDLTDHFSSALVSARHQVELEQARQAEQHRMYFLQRALDGSADLSELVRDGKQYGMEEQGNYWIVRGAVDPDQSESCIRLLDREGRTTHFRPLLGRHGTGIAGILGRHPRQADEVDATLAVVGPVSMPELTDAFGEATRILLAARRFGHRGIVDKETMPLRLAVVEQQDIGELLYERYITPVRSGSAMAGEVLESLRVFLDTGRSIQETAKTMSVHVNTLRYRFEKFEELTGRRLSDTQVLLETWWALQIDQIRPQPQIEL